MTWIGRKKIAFIPLHRTNAFPPDDPIPADWPAEIIRRQKAALNRRAGCAIDDQYALRERLF